MAATIKQLVDKLDTLRGDFSAALIAKGISSVSKTSTYNSLVDAVPVIGWHTIFSGTKTISTEFANGRYTSSEYDAYALLSISGVRRECKTRLTATVEITNKYNSKLVSFSISGEVSDNGVFTKEQTTYPRTKYTLTTFAEGIFLNAYSYDYHTTYWEECGMTGEDTVYYGIKSFKLTVTKIEQYY